MGLLLFDPAGPHEGREVNDRSNGIAAAFDKAAIRTIAVTGIQPFVVRALCEEDSARFAPLGERRFKGFPAKAQAFRLDRRN